MQNARLDEAQTGIKISGRNINNLRYADDPTFMAEFPIEIPVGFVSITGSCLYNSHCSSLWLKKPSKI